MILFVSSHTDIADLLLPYRLSRAVMKTVVFLEFALIDHGVISGRMLILTIYISRHIFPSLSVSTALHC